MRIERFSFKEFSEEANAASGQARIFRSLSKPAKDIPPPPPPAPTFSEEDLKSAERDAYQRGFNDGVKEGKLQAEGEQAVVNRTLSLTVEKFVDNLAPLFTEWRGMALSMREDMPRVAQAIARKIAGDALQAQPASLIESVVLHWLETMIHEPKLHILVHDSLASALEQKIRALAVKINASGEITVSGDSNLSLTDCRMEWAQGAMEHSNEALCAQIERAVDTMRASVRHDTIEHLDALEQRIIPDTSAQDNVSSLPT